MCSPAAAGRSWSTTRALTRPLGTLRASVGTTDHLLTHRRPGATSHSPRAGPAMLPAPASRARLSRSTTRAASNSSCTSQHIVGSGPFIRRRAGDFCCTARCKAASRISLDWAAAYFTRLPRCISGERRRSAHAVFRRVTELRRVGGPEHRRIPSLGAKTRPQVPGEPRVFDGRNGELEPLRFIAYLLFTSYKLAFG